MMKPSLEKAKRLFITTVLLYPKTVVFVAALASLLSLLYTATTLGFKTSRLDLVFANERYRRLDQEYEKEFENVDRIVIAVQSADRDRAKAFASSLANRLEADKENFDKVFYRFDIDALKGRALLYLSDDDLLALRRKLEKHRELIEQLAASPGLNPLFELVNREITAAMVGRVFTGFLSEEEGEEKEPVDLSLLISILTEMNERLDGRRSSVSPWETFLTKKGWKGGEDGFLWSEDKKFLFVLVNPKEATRSFNRFKAAVQEIRQEIADLRQGYPDVEVGVTGQAVLDSDEMGAAQRDMTVATLISLAVVVLLLFFFFRRAARPVFAIATLGVGLCWALGFVTLTVGHLNIITVTFAVLLIGLGIDYGIYTIARYEEERATGKEAREALERTLAAVGPGIATTAFTTGVAFYTLLLTNFKGLIELGFISGSGILLILLATFTVLPALLLLYDGRKKAAPDPRQVTTRGVNGGYLEGLYRHPQLTLGAGAVLVVLSLMMLGRVGSDFNLLHMQAEGTESVVWEQKILESAKRSVWFGVSLVDSIEEARRKEKALEALPSVANVESIASLIPRDQERKVRLVRGLSPFLAGVSLDHHRPEPVNLEALLSTLERIKFKMLEEGGESWDPKKRPPLEEMREVRRLIDRFVQETTRRGSAASQASVSGGIATGALRGQEEVLRALGGYQDDLVRDLMDKLDVLKRNLQARPMALEDIPPEFRDRFVGKTGRYRLLVSPAENIWEPELLQKFVEELRTVDPDVVGDPVLGFEHMRAMRRGYQTAGLYSIVGIALFTFLTFRELRSFLLALVPLAVGSLWTLGFMAVFQVKFNLANLIILPLIGAPGVEGGILIMYRYLEERRRSKGPFLLPRSTGKAVALSALTTMVGFGSLMISRHRGISSIGILLLFGVGCILLASLTVLPALLRIVPFRGVTWPGWAAGFSFDRLSAKDRSRLVEVQHAALHREHRTLNPLNPES